MKQKEITAKSKPELTKLLSELRETLRDLRFKVANKQLKNVRQIRDAKKTIARILTRLAVLEKQEKQPAQAKSLENKTSNQKQLN